MSMQEIWKTLSLVNANAVVEKKGKFSYLSWADAWALLMERYPESSYQLLDDVHYPDGSMEVRTTVTINGNTLIGYLPVMDNSNKAIKNPDACAINKARMRCLVKNIAMFGLGIYLYRGDDLPTESLYDVAVQLLAEDDAIAFYQWGHSLSEEAVSDAFSGAPQGQKMAFKERWREAMGKANAFFDEAADALRGAVDAGDASQITEVVDELTAFEKATVWNRLSDIEHESIRQLMKEVA